MVPGARPDAARGCPRRDPRPGPLSCARASARPVLLGSGRGPAAAEPQEHLQGTGERSWNCTRAPRLPRTLGEAGRAPAEQRPHRRDGLRGLASRARLGALHRRDRRRGQRAGPADRVHAVGQLCAEEGRPGRHLQAFGAEGAPPFPAVGARGFFGCRHFSKANAFLESKGLAPIDWALPECAPAA